MVLEPREKVLKIKSRQRLIGCAGKVYLEPGDSVYEVDPEEEGMVNVRTGDGNEGSIPVTAIGSKYLVLTGTRESYILEVPVTEKKKKNT